MEISNEIKAKVLAGYLGCKVQDEFNDKVGILEAIFLNNNVIVKHNVRHNLHFDEIKLLLKPLQDISDEDTKIVCEIAGYDENEGLNIDFIGGLWRRWIDLNEMKIVDNCYSYDHVMDFPLPNTIKICQFLQSKGYDLPQYLLGGKTLIEAGLAVDLKTIK